jgi:RNA methyltransferase, TrmH family
MEPVYARITSRQNPKIKNITLLQKHNEREIQECFVIEGLKEISKANQTGYIFESAFINPQIFNVYKVREFFGETQPRQIFEVSDDVYEKIAYRENSGGIVVVAKSKSHLPEEVRLTQNPLILVIEGVEKPGNIGAIYRTADAAGISAIVISGAKTDLYNPNAIRASIGCLFTVPTILLPTGQAINWLKELGVRIFCTHLSAAKPYHTCDFTGPTAIVVGTEDKGLSEEWVDVSDEKIIIPMAGAADSMNVSASTAVVVFEARRQRGFK